MIAFRIAKWSAGYSLPITQGGFNNWDEMLCGKQLKSTDSRICEGIVAKDCPPLLPFWSTFLAISRHALMTSLVHPVDTWPSPGYDSFHISFLHRGAGSADS